MKGFFLIVGMFLCSFLAVTYTALTIPRPYASNFYVEGCSVVDGSVKQHTTRDGYCVYLHNDEMPKDTLVSKPSDIKDAADLCDKLNKDMNGQFSSAFLNGEK